MINRYAIKEVEEIWSDEKKYQRWAKVELAVVEALNKTKIVSKKELDELIKHFKYDLNLIQELEMQTRHDVVAFIKCVDKLTLTNSKRWVHYGLTSTDIVDTANAIAYQETNMLISNEIEKLLDLIKKQANKYAKTLQIGRTHGQFAEPTSWGIKLALWYNEIKRDFDFFKDAKKYVEVGKISGAVGTYAHLNGTQIQDYVCKKLNLNSAKSSNQVLQRDRHAKYFSSLIILASSISTFATEIRNLSRSEINEVSEGFVQNQKGSSAMPQKKNPISCENICGLVRVIQGYSTVIYQNMNLWNERDISHSSAERIMNLDFLSLMIYVIRRFNEVLKNLIVREDVMLKNLKKSEPQIYSQTIMLYLIKDKNMLRDEAYDLIQPLVQKENDSKNLLNDLNKKLKNKISEKKFNELINPKYHIRFQKQIFDKIFKNK